MSTFNLETISLDDDLLAMFEVPKKTVAAESHKLGEVKASLVATDKDIQELAVLLREVETCEASLNNFKMKGVVSRVIAASLWEVFKPGKRLRTLHPPELPIHLFTEEPSPYNFDKLEKLLTASLLRDKGYVESIEAELLEKYTEQKTSMLPAMVAMTDVTKNSLEVMRPKVVGMMNDFSSSKDVLFVDVNGDYVNIWKDSLSKVTVGIAFSEHVVATNKNKAIVGFNTTVKLLEQFVKLPVYVSISSEVLGKDATHEGILDPSLEEVFSVFSSTGVSLVVNKIKAQFDSLDTNTQASVLDRLMSYSQATSRLVEACALLDKLMLLIEDLRSHTWKLIF